MLTPNKTEHSPLNRSKYWKRLCVGKVDKGGVGRPGKLTVLSLTKATTTSLKKRKRERSELRAFCGCDRAPHIAELSLEGEKKKWVQIRIEEKEEEKHCVNWFIIFVSFFFLFVFSTVFFVCFFFVPFFAASLIPDLLRCHHNNKRRKDITALLSFFPCLSEDLYCQRFRPPHSVSITQTFLARSKPTNSQICSLAASLVWPSPPT